MHRYYMMKIKLEEDFKYYESLQSETLGQYPRIDL